MFVRAEVSEVKRAFHLSLSHTHKETHTHTHALGKPQRGFFLVARPLRPYPHPASSVVDLLFKIRVKKWFFLSGKAFTPIPLLVARTECPRLLSIFLYQKIKNLWDSLYFFHWDIHCCNFGVVFKQIDFFFKKFSRILILILPVKPSSLPLKKSSKILF